MHAHVHAVAHLCECVWGPEDSFACQSSSAVCLVLKTGYFADLELAKEAKLDGQQAPEVCLSPSLSAGIVNVPPHPAHTRISSGRT